MSGALDVVAYLPLAGTAAAVVYWLTTVLAIPEEFSLERLARVVGARAEGSGWELDAGVVRSFGADCRATFGPIDDSTVEVAVFPTREVVAPDLRVKRETALVKVDKLLGRALEIEVGEAAFDDRYLLETSDGDAARRILEVPLRRAIDRLFLDLAIDSLAFERAGEVRARLRGGLLDRARLLTLVQRLVETSKLAGGAELKIELDVGRLRRMGRCGFCHVDVTPQEPSLVACARCSTIVHDACWNEHGGCPVLGCTGTRTTVKVRA